MGILEGMLSAFGEYKKLTVILIVAVIVMIIVWIMAIRASRKRGNKNDELLKKMREESMLREKFSLVTRETAQTADCRELIIGITANVQRSIEKEADIKEAFKALSEEKRYIYSLCYVFFEDAQTLSSFFRLNGKPLTTTASEAFSTIIGGEEATVFCKAYRMFDEDDETVSVVKEEVEENDKLFASFNKEVMLGKIRDYIADHAEAFQ